MAVTNTGIVERTIVGVNESDLFLDSEATSVTTNTGIVERSIVGVHDANFVRPLGDELITDGGFDAEGVQLITNGDFSNGAANWNLGAGWSIDGGIATIDGTQTSSSQLGSSVISVISGRNYKVVVNVISTSSGFRLYDDSGVISYGLSVGENVFYITATSSSYQLSPLGLSGTTGSIDNVSVKEVGQDWSLGTGWGIGDGKAVSDGSENKAISQNVSFNPSTLKINFEVSDLTQGSVRLFVNKPAFTQVLQATSNGSYEATVSVSSGANNMYFYSTSSFIGSIDNVSVKEMLVTRESTTTNTGIVERAITGLNESVAFRQDTRTNLITQSEAFDNAYYAKIRSTISTDQIVSPDGTQNADKFIEDSALGTKLLWTQDEVVSIGNVITWSVFAKKGERDWVLLKDTNAGNFSGYFDLENGVVGSTTSLDSSKIEDLGSGWYRCSITYTSTTTTARGRLYLADANNGESYQGNETSGLYIYGAQLEQSSYATSYIPTSGTAVTVDSNSTSVVNNTGIVERPVTGVNASDALFPDNTDSTIVNISDTIIPLLTALEARATTFENREGTQNILINLQKC